MAGETMQQSQFDMLKVFLIFLFFFGVLFLALLFSGPAEKDYYSDVFLLPETIPESLELSKAQIRELVFDENKNCYSGFPDVSLSFGINNREERDINYAVEYFAADDIQHPVRFNILDSEIVSLQSNTSMSAEKKFSTKKFCLRSPFFVGLRAKDRNKSYEIYYVLKNNVVQKQYSLLFLIPEKLPAALNLTVDQNNSLKPDANAQCYSNYPPLQFSFMVRNYYFENDMNYEILFYVSSAGESIRKNLVLKENFIIERNHELIVDKNLSIENLCIRFPLTITVESRFSTPNRVVFVVKKANVIPGE